MITSRPFWPSSLKNASLAALLLQGSVVIGQQNLFPPNSPPPLPRPSAPAVDPNDPNIEIKKPLPFSDQERRVLNSADKLPVERLQELLAVYERLNNTPMVDALVRAILRRDPKNAQALKARADLDPAEETRAVGYLENLAQKVIAGQKVEDIDSVGIHASNLLGEDRNEEALQLLQALKKNQFQGQFFPFLDDLALAFSETGHIDEAEEAYKTVAGDQRYPVEVRQEAQNQMPGLELKRQMQRIRDSAGANFDRLVDGAKGLMDRNPGNHDALAFYIECLDRSKRYAEAVDFLLALKTKVPPGAAWAWQPTLAYAYYGAKRFDDAVAAFNEIRNNRNYDPAAKLEAESMLIEIGVSRQIESGIIALNRSDLSTAEATLKRLEATQPNHSDTIGFKAIYLAKVGRSEEALQLLGEKRQQMEAQGLPFNQADALADVYVSRKEFTQARSTVLQILNDSRYEEEAKSAARIQLANIQVSEKLEEGYLALRDLRRDAARQILDEVRAMSPDNEQVAIFAAEVDLAYGRRKEALSQLSALKAKNGEGLAFEGQNSYANALAQNDEWHAAAQAYKETLEQIGYLEQDRLEAIWALRGLNPYIRPHLDANVRYSTEEEGSILSTEAAYLSGWHQNWRYGAFARTDSASVEGESVYSGLKGDRYEGGALLQRRFKGGYFAEATLGGSAEGVIYSARVGRMGVNRLAWSIGWDGNARATDSVALQALDGREDRLSASIVAPINERFVVTALAYYNWTNIGGETLGDGFGAEVQADYVLQSETKTRPELTLSYVGEYRKFDHASTIPTSAQREIRRAVPSDDETATGDPTRDILNTLVDEETNRQGALFRVSKHFGDSLNAYAQVGAYYAFDDESLEFLGALGAEYWITDNSMIFTELRYDTSGTGGSSGTGVFEANLGGQINF